MSQPIHDTEHQQRAIAPPNQVDFSKLNQRQVERVVWTELLADLRWQRQSFTEFAARLQGRLVNDVLEVGQATFDANGFVQRQWRAAAGSVKVNNLSAHPIVVSSAPASASAPTGGVGVYTVNANTRDVVAVASRVVTFYGTPGDVFCYQAFTNGPTPATV